MSDGFSSSRLVPRGLALEHLEHGTKRIGMTVRATAAAACCPDCGACSRRVQSRYSRQAADLPIAGRRVDLNVVVRSFWCDGVLCGRRIFAERFGHAVLAPWARRTGRIEEIVHHFGLALGGRPAASIAQRLMLPVSNDTLLRVVRRRAWEPADMLVAIGIDDFAWRRNHRYGTIVCDLERCRPVVLLKDREQATARALPHAVQIADRWHLMENASRAFLDAVGASMLLWRNAQWDSGSRNATALWRKLKQHQGFRGSLRVIGEWATRRRRAEMAGAETLTRVPSARTIARLMTISHDNLTKVESVIVAAVEGGVPTVIDARETIADFHAMVLKKDDSDLGLWINRALCGLVATFGRGVIRDEAAVRAAIVIPWSNGQTEGQITKLKLVKRQMYGRGKLGLLQAGHPQYPPRRGSHLRLDAGCSIMRRQRLRFWASGLIAGGCAGLGFPDHRQTHPMARARSWKISRSKL